MRALATDMAHIFFSLPVYLVFLLLAMSIMAFRKERNSMHFRWRFLYVALFGFFYMASAPVFSNALVNRIESIYAVPDIQDFRGSKQHVVLVLTAGWLRQAETGYETKIGEAGWERILTGVELWRHVGGNLLFTGAPAPDGKDSAAQAMARVARLMGVPGEAILLETRSLNTFENLKFSKSLMERPKGRIFLVTSALNMPRAVAVAGHLGVDAIPYPCDFRADRVITWQSWIPSNEGASALEGALHELVGVIVYRWRGWI